MNQQFYQPQEQVESDFSLEEKLLEGIFQPTGISVKPSDTLLNDFCKRAKNLNREKIFNILMEKVEPFKEYPGNTEKTKLLTKCLYLIEHLVEHKVEELYDAFDERLELFEEIRSVFSNNTKETTEINHSYLDKQIELSVKHFQSEHEDYKKENYFNGESKEEGNY